MSAEPDVIVRGIMPMRVVSLVLGASCIVFGVASFWTVPDVDELHEYLAVAIFAVPLALGGAWFVVKALEFVRISDVGVASCNPIWRTRTITWDKIQNVELKHDVYTVIPVITTSEGTSRLRGAASWTQGPNSAAARAVAAIRHRLAADERTNADTGRRDRM